MFISFAQNFEDVILNRVLSRVENGFYIDVGASDPVEDSVTKAFYEKGWSGINIEPVARFHQALCEDRPRDVNLSCVVGKANGFVAFHDVTSVRGWGSPRFELAEHYRHNGLDVSTSQVPMFSLAAICEQYAADRPIHFLKIDAEGSEPDVIQGMDFSRWRPWIVVIEAVDPVSREADHACIQRIVSCDYQAAYFDGLNWFLVANERAEIADHLREPPNVFDEFVRNSEIRAKEDVESLTRTLAAVQSAASGPESRSDFRNELLPAISEEVQVILTTFLTRLSDRESEDSRPLRGEIEEISRTLRQLHDRQGTLDKGANDSRKMLARLEHQLSSIGEDLEGLRADVSALETGLAIECVSREGLELEAFDTESVLQEQLSAANVEIARQATKIAKAEEKVAQLNQSSHHWYSHAKWAETRIAELDSSSHQWRTIADAREQRLRDTYASASWRITGPMRWVSARLRRLRRYVLATDALNAARNKETRASPTNDQIGDARSAADRSLEAPLSFAGLEAPLIFLYVDHTVQFDANTGLQRVARQLGRSLMANRRPVVFVAWDAASGNLRAVSHAELESLSKWNGPEVTEYRPPPAMLEFLRRPTGEASAGTWLVIPEVTHITATGAAVTRELLRAAKSRGLRTCAIFYDAIPLKRKEYSDSATRHLEYMRQIATADLVVPISQFSANDFLHFLGTQSLSAQVKAIPLPAESTLSPRQLRTDIAPEKMILSVGSITRHKNQISLMRVFAAIASSPAARGWRLRLVGHVHPDLESECSSILSSNPRIEILRGASDEELAVSYRAAAFTVFPSIEEGFGLPIAESLWFGKPCICASFGAMAELAGRGGVLSVDVSDEQVLKQSILDLMGDSRRLSDFCDAAVAENLSTWSDYSEALCSLLVGAAELGEAAQKSRNGRPRVFWLGMHKILVRTELPRLRFLGLEVFNPAYLSDIVDQSAEMNWDCSQESSLPKEVFDHFATTNFFYARLDAKTLDLLNRYFDVVIVTISPTWLKPILEGFRGKVVYRVYGQSFDLSAELELQGLSKLIAERDDFSLVSHSAHAIEDERDWILRRSHVVPYCLTDEVFGYQDSWIHPPAGKGKVGISCPNIANSYYFEHYKFIKQHFRESWFRIYGVQTTRVDDPLVVGTIARHKLLSEWQMLACYLYTYPDPHVCYLPPIECMVIGVPVLFPAGSLLDRYFEGASAPGRYSSPVEANDLCRRLVGGDAALAKSIVESQKNVRLMYTPSYVWPKFDSFFCELINV